MRPIEIRRGSNVLLIGRTGSFPAALLKAGDRQRRDAFLTNLSQEREVLEQIRSQWTRVFPAAVPEQLVGAEIARTVQRGLRSGAVQIVLLRMPRMPLAPAEVSQVASGTINAGTAQRRLLIARKGGLPPEFLAYSNSAAAIAVLGRLGDDSATARQIDLQAGRLNAGGRAALRGRPLRQNLAWQINAGSLDAAVITEGPAASGAASRPDAQKPIGDMTGNERIGAALQRSLPYAIEAGGEQIRQSIEDMLQPQSILIMIGLAAAVAIANLHPVSGAAVDTTLLLMAWWSGGNEAIGGVTDFAIATLDARDATSERELDEAARAYGKALGRMGPKLLSAIVNRFLAKAGGKGAKEGGAGLPTAKIAGKRASATPQKSLVAKSATLTAAARKSQLLKKGVPAKTLDALKNDKQLAAFEKAMADIDKLNLSQMAGKGTVFYSGSAHGKPAWQSAARMAKEKDMNWITAVSGGVLDKNRSSIPPKAMNFLDVKLSRKLAESASGEIKVIGDPRTMNVENGIFYKEELPRLLDNSKISALSKAELRQLKQVLDAKARALDAAKAAGNTLPFNSVF